MPFLAGSNGLVDLNSLIAAGTGFTLTDAVAINNSGQILCDANNAVVSSTLCCLLRSDPIRCSDMNSVTAMDRP